MQNVVIKKNNQHLPKFCVQKTIWKRWRQKLALQHFAVDRKCKRPKPVNVSFDAFPKSERIFSTEKQSGWLRRMQQGLLWRQMKHDINRDEKVENNVCNAVLLHIFWRKNIISSKTVAFWFVQVEASFSICLIFRSLLKRLRHKMIGT